MGQGSDGKKAMVTYAAYVGYFGELYKFAKPEAKENKLLLLPLL